MNIILSILIASFLALLWLLNFQWYFDLSVVNIINIDWTFDADLSWVKHTIDFVLYIPEQIFNIEKELIKELFSKYINLTKQEIYVWIMFLFHLILSLIIEVFAKIVWWYNHKKHVIIWMILFYLFLIYMTKVFTNIF